MENHKRRVLIVTYYWPPNGGSAVLRWVKFTKYLRRFGWEPIIYTPLNPEYMELDQSLVSDIPEGIEILRKKILEPYIIYKLLTGRKKSDLLGVSMMSEKKRPGLMARFSLWIRSNLFIPDPRILWVRPSVRFLRRYLHQNKIDAMITTGPPHSMHLIGLRLKKTTGIRWVADFRDPWTNIDFYKDLPVSRFADKKQRRLEREVLCRADRILTVSPGMTSDFERIRKTGVVTITNGYDDMQSESSRAQPPKFIILHLGSMPKSRNPASLWKAIQELQVENKEFSNQLEIRLVGKVDLSVKETLSSTGLHPFVTYQSYVSHEKTGSLLAEASVLLLCINDTPNSKSILTNKFFEYLAARRPIVATGPVDGDAAILLSETGAGKIFDYPDQEGLKSFILKLFTLYSEKKLTVENRNIDKYSRENLTSMLGNLLNSLCNE